jgi:predicted esterase
MVKQRILCLHGYGQSATFFNQRIGSLRKGEGCLSVSLIRFLLFHPFPHPLAALKPLVEDFTFVDGTFPATAEFLGESERGSALSWWQWEDAARASLSYQYKGVDRSLERILKVVDERGPFDGVLGFSQGAAMAALLCLRPPRRPPFRYAILVSGFVPRDPHWSEAFEAPPASSLASLHVYGQTDESVPPPSCLRLARCFVDPVVHAHPGGHAVPSDATFRALLKEFVASHAPKSEEAGASKEPKVAAMPDVEAVRSATEAYPAWRQIRGVDNDFVS